MKRLFYFCNASRRMTVLGRNLPEDLLVEHLGTLVAHSQVRTHLQDR